MLYARDFSPLLWKTLENAGNSEEKLRLILTSLDKESVLLIHKEFMRAFSNLWGVSDAADALLSKQGESEISEDTMKDIFAYAISRGQSYYDEVLRDPQRLPRDIDPGDVPILWVPGQVFWHRFGEEIMDYRD